jgi:cobalt-precorrin-5B (C1)-methyltransferase
MLNKKNLDYGITTGSAATAAALAALFSLKREVKKVNIKTPLGKLEIIVNNSEKVNPELGKASVIKMPYPDPDVTRNLEIVAKVQLKNSPGITISGGEGVGTVTKPGLQVPIGHSAINPTPQEMIRNNLSAHLPPGKGADVTIIIPRGREIAKKTMNPRLGIIDGISILGTTGIARPMSNSSYKKALKCQLDVAQAEGYGELIFVPGNIGEKLAKKILKKNQDQIIQMGNQVGFMLEEAHKMGYRNLTLLGHAGKIVKIAAGIFNTEHKIADGRREIITTHAALQELNPTILKAIYNCNTTEDMINILKEENKVKEVFNSIAMAIKSRVLEVYGIKLEVMIMEMNGNILNNNYYISFE